MTPGLIYTVIASLSLQCPASPAATPETLRVATYAYPGVDRRAAVAGTAEFLSRRLGIPARVEVLPDPVALASALRNGSVHVGVVNLLGYLVLSGDSTTVIPSVTFRVPGSAVPYEATLVASEPVVAESLRSRAAALRMTFVSPGSTTGNLFPRIYLATLGIDSAESAFKSVSYAGTHAKAFEMLGKGEADVAALAGEELDKQLATLPDRARFRILWRSGNLPLGPVVLSCTLGAEARGRITRALGDMHGADPAAFAALKGGWVEARAADALVPVVDSTYGRLRQMIGGSGAARRILEQLAR